MSQASSRNAKIAGVAALAGTMVAVAIVAATRAPAPTPTLPVAMGGNPLPTRLAQELDRCSTLTMPDAGCEAAWAENRHRFFGQPGSERAAR
ncbi:conjugative transfer region protein TrbK [Hephaestia caeni]|uniref:Conjugative transfer region protein TrbK n=1 Tax=Hephaestia caeni TaxID=645617 RepID=A0A397PB10_9SPHN|nr:putative entry exclusion protein TrbK-alt [Hephaestia caeni]RIA46766.1 conjugative transfer region protein TrbK [Hephaestia caeni]